MRTMSITWHDVDKDRPPIGVTLLMYEGEPDSHRTWLATYDGAKWMSDHGWVIESVPLYWAEIPEP